MFRICKGIKKPETVELYPLVLKPGEGVSLLPQDGSDHLA